MGGQLYVQQLAGSYAGEHFTVASDGFGGTLLTLSAGAPMVRAELFGQYVAAGFSRTKDAGLAVTEIPHSAAHLALVAAPH
jgi:hypothetical protein